jgi:hypothetical protein
MITPAAAYWYGHGSEPGRLLAVIAAATDEAEVIDVLLLHATVIGELPERERERVNERLTDAVREWREAHTS